MSSSDYIDGSSISVEFTKRVTLDELQLVMADLGYPEAMIQESDDNSFVIRIDKLNNQQKNEFVEGMNFSIISGDDGGLLISFICLVPLDFVCPISIDLVSPVIARETVVNAFWAVLAATIGIFFYIWWAFRNVPSPLRYSVYCHCGIHCNYTCSWSICCIRCNFWYRSEHDVPYCVVDRHRI